MYPVRVTQRRAAAGKFLRQINAAECLDLFEHCSVALLRFSENDETSVVAELVVLGGAHAYKYNNHYLLFYIN